jgi:hypothetical protein
MQVVLIPGIMSDRRTWAPLAGRFGVHDVGTLFALNNSEAIDFVRIRGGFARHFLQGFV